MSSADGSASARVIEATAARTDRDALDLPPLAETVDPEALDAIADDSSAVLTFPYAGVDVTVDETGTVTLDERADAHVNGGRTLGDD
ncbi:HalOD1 output domain-containing protein [Halorubellus salinus]|uniref:HalOD1 output domain-containing protein n=1 Tax=Halorubellus salinus TaxID=755309 RepID=UPI001D092BB8|nr:HalOD1 output domain-containing protein [Halorubellus salinus]